MDRQGVPAAAGRRRELDSMILKAPLRERGCFGANNFAPSNA